MDATRRANAASFGRAAQAYERGRPSYPPPAIDWLLPENARQVLDLGAGTGKLTASCRHEVSRSPRSSRPTECASN